MQVVDVTLPQVFFKHIAIKNQLADLSIIRTLVENGLIIKDYGGKSEPHVQYHYHSNAIDGTFKSYVWTCANVSDSR